MSHEHPTQGPQGPESTTPVFDLDAFKKDLESAGVEVKPFDLTDFTNDLEAAGITVTPFSLEDFVPTPSTPTEAVEEPEAPADEPEVEVATTRVSLKKTPKHDIQAEEVADEAVSDEPEAEVVEVAEVTEDPETTTTEADESVEEAPEDITAAPYDYEAEEDEPTGDPEVEADDSETSPMMGEDDEAVEEAEHTTDDEEQVEADDMAASARADIDESMGVEAIETAETPTVDDDAVKILLAAEGTLTPEGEKYLTDKLDSIPREFESLGEEFADLQQRLVAYREKRKADPSVETIYDPADPEYQALRAQYLSVITRNVSLMKAEVAIQARLGVEAEVEDGEEPEQQPAAITFTEEAVTAAANEYLDLIEEFTQKNHELEQVTAAIAAREKAIADNHQAKRFAKMRKKPEVT